MSETPKSQFGASVDVRETKAYERGRASREAEVGQLRQQIAECPWCSVGERPFAFSLMQPSEPKAGKGEGGTGGITCTAGTGEGDERGAEKRTATAARRRDAGRGCADRARTREDGEQMSDEIAAFVKEQRELCEQATPGPWVASGIRQRIGDYEYVAVDRESGAGVAFIPYSDQTLQDHLDSHADQHYIAASRISLPRALDIIEQFLDEHEFCTSPDRLNEILQKKDAHIRELEREKAEHIETDSLTELIKQGRLIEARTIYTIMRSRMADDAIIEIADRVIELAATGGSVTGLNNTHLTK